MIARIIDQSLTSQFSKMFENILKVRMFSFLDTNSLISNSQFGFQKSISKCDALINYIDYLNINYNVSYLYPQY